MSNAIKIALGVALALFLLALPVILWTYFPPDGRPSGSYEARSVGLKGSSWTYWADEKACVCWLSRWSGTEFELVSCERLEIHGVSCEEDVP